MTPGPSSSSSSSSAREWSRGRVVRVLRPCKRVWGAVRRARRCEAGRPEWRVTGRLPRRGPGGGSGGGAFVTGALPMRLRCSCSRSCSLARMSSFEISSAVPWPGCLQAGPPELGWAVFAVLGARGGVQRLPGLDRHLARQVVNVHPRHAGDVPPATLLLAADGGMEGRTVRCCHGRACWLLSGFQTEGG